jgi:hypothetical protein
VAGVLLGLGAGLEPEAELVLGAAAGAAEAPDSEEDAGEEPAFGAAATVLPAPERESVR